MSILKKQEHNEWMANYKSKGGKTTEYICQHCDNLIEIPCPTPEQVSGKKYWDGVKECPECTGHKLELAALMIAQGMSSDNEWFSGKDPLHHIAKQSVLLAKLVLEEANK